jgi:transcriptional regulator with GAF, ATPase, and Fis domain
VLNSETGSFERRFAQGAYHGPEQIIKTDSHDDFAVRKGFMLTDRTLQLHYFEAAMEDLSKIMPLIADDQLYGFIFSCDGDADEMLGDSFLTRFNYLMNLAIEKAFRYFERATLRREIDKRIFDLESISQTVKQLFSELDTQRILQLSLDVIRELTTSSTTSVGLYDPVEQCINVKAYDDLKGGVPVAGTLKRRAAKLSCDKVVFDMARDHAALLEIFEDLAPLHKLSAAYVILMAKEDVTGIITLGTPVGRNAYSADIFDRIEDIASLMQLALINAQQYETIVSQKEQLRLKFNTLRQMNKIIKSINRAETLAELYQLIADAMTLTFGVEAMLLLSYENNAFSIAACHGIESEGIDETLLRWIRQMPATALTVHYTVDAVMQQLPDAALGERNCIVLAPVSMHQIGQDVLGYILVTRTRFRLHETQVNMIEMLSNSIAPVLYQMRKNEKYQSDYMIRPEAALKALHQQYAEMYQIYQTPYRVYFQKLYPADQLSLTGFTPAYADYVDVRNVRVFFSENNLSKDAATMVSDENPSLSALYAMLEKFEKEKQ